MYSKDVVIHMNLPSVDVLLFSFFNQTLGWCYFVVLFIPKKNYFQMKKITGKWDKSYRSIAVLYNKYKQT